VLLKPRSCSIANLFEFLRENVEGELGQLNGLGRGDSDSILHRENLHVPLLKRKVFGLPASLPPPQLMSYKAGTVKYRAKIRTARGKTHCALT
jgi:hypothetical protein